MSYYSEVVLLLSLQARQDLQDLASDNEALAEFIDEAQCKEYPCGAVLLQWHQVEWDDAIDDWITGPVHDLMRFIHYYDAHELCFVRCGADMEDIVGIGFLTKPANVSVTRKITIEEGY